MYFKNPNNSNDDNAYGRALSLGYFLEHYAFITDMLWHYSDQAYVDSLKDSLAVITAFADSVLRVSEPFGNPASHPPYFPDWPRTEYHNIRLRLIGALGYAGCILDSGRYVAYADSQLFNYSSGRYLFNGYLNFGRGNGGYYKEGQSYFSFSMHGLTLFFAAHNRMHGINHFNNPSVMDMVDRSLNLIGPDFYNIPIDDCWKTYFRWQGNSTGYLRSPNFNYGCYEFFQQSTQASSELLDDISWYIKNYHNQFSSSGIFTVYDRIPMIISYNAKDVLNHHPTPHIPPARYKNSIESDEELTIIRESGIRDISDYRNSLNLIVNHENSYHGLVHEQDDQGSFQLYYRGKHLLIDPGYQSGAWYHHGRDWLNSAYAHNLPLIKPDAINEQENLNTDYKLPISTNVINIEKIPPLGVTNIHSGTWGNTEYKAVRTYFSETSSIKEMQIELNYDNIENDDYLLKRNFFLLDNKFVIVRDYFTKEGGQSYNLNPA